MSTCYLDEMKTRIVGVWGFAVGLGACGSVTAPRATPDAGAGPDASTVLDAGPGGGSEAGPDAAQLHVGGTVRGMWTGAAGVALHLQSGAAGDDLTVAANGRFAFAKPLAPGAAYAVTLAQAPAEHTCTVEAGTGDLGDRDVDSVGITCRGPDVSVDVSGASGWVFDPAMDTQSFSGSVVAQDVSFAVHGAALTEARIAGVATELGSASAAIPLALGATTVEIAVTAGGLSKTYQLVFQRGVAMVTQSAYGKASNTDPSDAFGNAIAMSGDTLVIGAAQESSAAIGINGNAGDNSAPGAGAVYVFTRSGDAWTQQAYIKASNTQAGDGFGSSVALSGDTLLVGAPGEDSISAAINAGQTDNSASNAGAAYVFVRNGTAWTQQAYLKTPNMGAGDQLGFAVAVSGDLLAVAAPREDSAAKGVDGNMNDETASSSGAVYVFVRAGTTWRYQSYLKASNTGSNDLFGFALALAGDTLAVSADAEASAAFGVGGDQLDDSAPNAGAVYVFMRSHVDATWSQQAYIKASNTGAGDFFGSAVALSGDTLAVGAYHEASAATTVNGNQSDNSAAAAGAVYVFARTGTAWAQQAYVKASNTGAGDLFGASVALSADTLAVGAYAEDSTATDPADNTSKDAGAAYVFTRTGTTWSQQSFVKPASPTPGDLFGWSVALTSNTLVIGALQESSCATGLNPPGGQTDHSCASAGAVYVFR